MLVFTTSLPTIQSQYADYHRPASSVPPDYYADAVAEAEYQLTVARARAEAARREMEYQAQLRQQTEVLFDREAAVLSSYPHACFQEVVWPASSSIRAQREEKRRQTLLTQQRQREQMRAQALARQRAERERRVQVQREARRVPQHTEQLLALVKFLAKFGGQGQQPSVNTLSHPGTSQVPRVYKQNTSRPAGARFLVNPSATTPIVNAHKVPPVDEKGKARETPAIPLPKSVPVVSSKSVQPFQPTVADILKERKDSEADSEIREALDGLLKALYGLGASADSNVNVKTPSSPQVHSSLDPLCRSDTESRLFQNDEVVKSAAADVKEDVPVTEPASIKRTPAISAATAEKIREVFYSRRARKLSLGAIKEIEETLRSLESSFVFPSQLDFTPSSNGSESASDSEGKSPLLYTSNNRPIHTFQHALNTLLEKLDAVDSHGDLEVRGRRKEVVIEVERALKEVDRKVEESRERASLAETPVSQESLSSSEERIPEPVEASSTSAPDTQVDVAVQEALHTSNADIVTEATPTSSQIPENSIPTSTEDLLPQPSLESDTRARKTQAGIPREIPSPLETTPGVEDVSAVVKSSTVAPIQPELTLKAEDVVPSSPAGNDNNSLDDAVPTATSPREVEKVLPVTEESQLGVTSSSSDLVILVSDTKDDTSLPPQSTNADTPSEPITSSTPSSPSSPSSLSESDSPNSSDNETAYLLQSSPIADPEPRKSTAKKDTDDDDIDIVQVEEVSQGVVDVEGKEGKEEEGNDKDSDGWSEVEA
ncbi:unnamed protein product [Somion occarium]|uniref:BAG domain-containing protein n=1 Tax=Somion occarium TaxID=3059160 RepID=A0ABP1CTU4_9APHY